MLASQPIWLFGIVCLLAGGLAGLAAYFGVQSIRQGLLLRSVVPPHQLTGKIGQAIAVQGHARRLDPGGDPMRANALWVRTRVQEYRRRTSSSGNRTGSWRTVSDDKKQYPFELEVGEHALPVHAHASEVHGAKSRTSYHETGAGGVLGFFGGTRSGRTIVETLHAGQITVVGRLASRGDGTLSLTTDESVGLLLTGYSGSTQAAFELAKGVLGVLLPFAWLAGSVWLYQNHF